ncbi:MAG: cobalt-precorrin-5B (C(1))-methyltransferase CbiD [Lachnospiraceae bacterium]|nr:cobalt-precorrin-5B (C(1))-methyltransferase CbiD [Lachnospiraceae bacterium]
MTSDLFVISQGKNMRCGFTTGTCAALAALGSAKSLLSKKAYRGSLSVITPKGIRIEAEVNKSIYDPGSDTAVCSVIKDGGDDKDVTNDLEIFVRTEYISDSDNIEIEGGEGIGRVTREGLGLKVGEAAINPVPKQMIENAVNEAREEAGYTGGIRCTLYIPNGEKIAESTFNKRLGIEGGLSIIGTSGIVEPMSEKAFSDAVCLEIRQLAAEGNKKILLTPGNYGKEYVKAMGLCRIPLVMCSNFIGDALDACILYGFEEVLITGHAGKLLKLAGGIMNTHSRMADARMELITAHAAINNASPELCRRLMEQDTTEEALKLLKETDIYETTVRSLLDKIQYHLDERIRKDLAEGKIEIGAIIFSAPLGSDTGEDCKERLIGMTEAGERIFRRL